MDRKKTDPWNVSKLLELFEESCRPKGVERVGVELERQAVLPSNAPFCYASSRPNMQTLLEGLSHQKGYEIVGKESILGFSTPEGKVSLEPGSQLEFSADPKPTIDGAFEALKTFFTKAEEEGKKLGLRWLDLGVTPYFLPESLDLIPHRRYHIMTEHLRKSGELGLSMMRLTTSVQLNFDYCSPANAIQLLQVAQRASPLSYALFSNSPWYNGKQTGLLSFRSEIWRKTDPSRCGFIPRSLEAGYTLSDYSDHLWHLPLMYYQDEWGEYHAAEGNSLADLEKKDPKTVDPQNTRNAIQQIFTEARLKPGYVEVRSIDGLPLALVPSAIAFWWSLIYSEEIQTLLQHSFLGKMEAGELAGFNGQVSETGWTADLSSLAVETLELAKKFLEQRGFDEERHLAPLFEFARQKENPALQNLKKRLTPGP